MHPLLKPSLYQAEGALSAPDRPALLGGQCVACGHVFFPMQSYGCEVCGSLDMQPKSLAGVGTLIASARVHLHPGKGREAPFTVVAVKLDDGPVARTLTVNESADFRPGVRMVSVLTPVLDAEGAPHSDLRFVSEG